MKLNDALLVHSSLSEANKIWGEGAEMLLQVSLAIDKSAQLMTA